MAQFGGVHVATTTPFRESDLAVDLDRCRAHAAWLIDEGIDGLFPVGSLGEYESLTIDERQAVVAATAEETRGRALLVPGVSAPSSTVACQLAASAAEVGADGVMVLPPTNHAPTDDELWAHFSAVAEVGLPVVLYNNPASTRIDLTPDRLARLARIDGVVAVKDFSGDVRRVSAIAELAPDLEVLCGVDDGALEYALMGSVGWIGGFTGVFPRATRAVFEAGLKGDVAAAIDTYRRLLPALRWDPTPRFVESIKLAVDAVGAAGGGVVRPPRLPLPEADAARLRALVREIDEATG